MENRARNSWKIARISHLKNDYTTVLQTEEKTCSDSCRNSLEKIKKMMLRSKWNKGGNRVMGENLSHKMQSRLCRKKELERQTRKKSLQTFSKLVTVHQCRKH